MFIRILKWVGIVIGVLIGIVIIALVSVTVVSANRINRTYQVTADFSITVPDDPESIAEGERHFTIWCASCHAETAAGEEFVNDFMFGRIYTANLTSGANGIASKYTDEEIAQVIWYGVRPDGSPTVGMPYELNQAINTEDMGNLIAYLRSVPPVDTDYPKSSYGPMLRVMHVTGMFPAVPVEYIDLSAPPPSVVSAEDTVAYGEYLAVFCTACHGPDFTGLEMFGSPNITPHETAIGTWTEEEFTRAVTEGIRPDGTTLDPEQMPWETLSLYTDEEIQAIWTYLQTVDPVARES